MCNMASCKVSVPHKRSKKLLNNFGQQQFDFAAKIVVMQNKNIGSIEQIRIIEDAINHPTISSDLQ